MLTEANCMHWKEFVPDLEDCIAYIVKHPEENNRADAALYGLSEKIPDKGFFGIFLIDYLEAVLDTI